MKDETDIEYHLKRIKAIQNTSFDEQKGNLMARVFVRKVGAVNDGKGNYIINQDDLIKWFENLDYLKTFTEYDTI